MKLHRKCDQAKFKKRKARALENRRENARQQAIRDAHWAEIKEKNRQDRLRMEEFEREWRRVEQRLVNILAKRLCQLDPEYEKELRGKQAIANIKALFGALKEWAPELYTSHVISEEPFMGLNKENTK
jgi:hypothetical protein